MEATNSVKKLKSARSRGPSTPVPPIQMHRTPPTLPQTLSQQFSRRPHRNPPEKASELQPGEPSCRVAKAILLRSFDTLAPPPHSCGFTRPQDRRVPSLCRL